MSGKGKMDAELEQLFSGWVDETLSGAEEVLLQERLRESAAVRLAYRRFMELESGMRWSYSQVASAVAEERLVVFPLWLRAVAVAVALVLGLVAGGLLWPERPVVEVMASHGQVGWAPVRGKSEAVVEGASLGVGTLRLEGVAASVQVRFEDGTLINLAGDTEAEIDEGAGGKLVVFRFGALTANVERQPPGRPLTIRTPSAEAEVVGTAFSLMADGEKTALGVESGQVNLRRLSDGQTVAVAERSAAVARLDAGEAMEVLPWVAPPARWSAGIGEAGGEVFVSKGEVRADGLGAVSYVAARRGDGTPVVRAGVSFRGEARHGGDFVSLLPDSQLRMRYRVLDADTKVKVMLSTHGPGMTFAGNFEVTLDADVAGEWRWVTLPVAGLVPLQDGTGRVAATSVSLLLVSTTSGESGLEVGDVAIAPLVELDEICPIR